VQVVKRLLQRAKRDKVLQFRFCARFLPCTHICKADSAAITEASKALVSEAFDSGVSFGKAGATVGLSWSAFSQPLLLVGVVLTAWLAILEMDT
jgi:hypothetical protein